MPLDCRKNLKEARYRGGEGENCLRGCAVKDRQVVKVAQPFPKFSV